MINRISITNHDEIRSAMKGVFQIQANPFRAYYYFEQRQQGGIETTQDYLAALRSLMAGCDFKGRENYNIAVWLGLAVSTRQGGTKKKGKPPSPAQD
ncbi:hypothetical protein PoB_007458800 [Plakobranchus ocellatus]|uniref:Uncharacterized protein n=1 Tax=Plakobranchus ocellatus TaxID=259542 RepID=A0AAV4DVG8_9GAST|nr:hypothetical protein PoB_007458800 [Plakobranchus ocellatus]